VHATAGELQPTQVKHIARDIINVVEETFPKSIELEQTIPSDLWPVMGNATQIHQVLLNLCVNARDAMPQGGTLKITAANRRLDARQAGASRAASPAPGSCSRSPTRAPAFRPTCSSACGRRSSRPRA
jgi:two-component system, cell cycle sensor histidine kinase and response regulator CckA